MIVKFICGCQTKEIIDRENVKTMDMVEFDADGFLICAIHHQRRYGWRSLPQLPGLKLSDWRFHSWSPLEIEGHILFGDPLPIRAAKEVKSNGNDWRDNRDPQTLVRGVHHLDRGGRVHSHPDGEPFFVVPREEPDWYVDSQHDELQARLAEIKSRRGSSVLPWPEHKREQERNLRDRLQREASQRDRADQA